MLFAKYLPCDPLLLGHFGTVQNTGCVFRDAQALQGNQGRKVRCLSSSLPASVRCCLSPCCFLGAGVMMPILQMSKLRQSPRSLVRITG